MTDALARARNNADALRHFNERVSAGMDLRPPLAHVHAPTLVITGEIDPFASAAREIADALPERNARPASGRRPLPVPR